jgi:hypothetical protein
MYNNQLQRALKGAKVTGRKTRTKLHDTVGEALLAYYLNGGRESRRIRDVVVNPGYCKLPSGRQLRAA